MATHSKDKLHWRYSLIVNACLLFLLPTSGPDTTGKAAKHFLSLLNSELLPLRQLALGVVSFQVDCLISSQLPVDEMNVTESVHFQVAGLSDKVHGNAQTASVLQAVKDVLDVSSFPSDLLTKLSHNHTTLFEDEGTAQRSRNHGAISREEAVVKSISATLNRFREWPVAAKKPSAVKTGHFIVHHARSFFSLTRICPTVCGSFYGHRFSRFHAS